jgi:hypothetical protein
MCSVRGSKLFPGGVQSRCDCTGRLSDMSCSKPTEIATRTAIFTAVGQVGSMFAGLMMTAMHETMEGRAGLKGWQWVFVIGIQAHPLFPENPLTTKTVGLMGIPVAAFGFVSHVGYSAVRTQSNALAVHIPRPTGVDEREVSQC